MSIILKGNNISSNNDGIGPSEVTNIKASQNASSIILSWTNPSNVVIDGTTLSTFDHVIIVRNEDHYPMSIKDGNTIYSGNGITCSDSNVIKNKKYYYRFFVYDTNKLCNNNMSMIIENTFYGIDPILKNNTWSQIAAASESGIASSLWNIGDEIDVTLSGYYSDTVTLQIWDFNHYDKSDGTGKAGICFGMKNLMAEKTFMSTDSNNRGGWYASNLRKNNMQNILNSMPASLQNVIKMVEIYTHAGGYGSASEIEQGNSSYDKVFIPGYRELFGDKNTSQSNGEQGQQKFSIFTDNNSRIKKMYNGTGKASKWWTRSPAFATTSSSDTYYCIVSENGSSSGGYMGNSDTGICFMFNV